MKSLILFSIYSPILSKSSPPAAYSKKIYSVSFCLRVPKYRNICGCCKNFWMHTSFFTDANASGCFRVSTIFIATASLVCRFSNSLTLHITWQKRIIKNQLIIIDWKLSAELFVCYLFPYKNSWLDFFLDTYYYYYYAYSTGGQKIQIKIVSQFSTFDFVWFKSTL